MKHLIFSLYALLTINMSVCYGQENPRLDTIKLANMYSDIPILSSTENLILCLGTCSSMSFNFYANVHISNALTHKDTLFYFNKVYYSKKGISYLEKNGTVILQDFDFKKNKKMIFLTEKIQLCRNLTLDELMKIYHYTNENVAGPQVGLMAPYRMRKCRCFYQVNFLTGEPINAKIELYFDCRKNLRYMLIRNSVFW